MLRANIGGVSGTTRLFGEATMAHNVANSLELYRSSIPIPRTNWKIVDYDFDGSMYGFVVEVAPGQYVDVAVLPHDSLYTVMKSVRRQLSEQRRTANPADGGSLLANPIDYLAPCPCTLEANPVSKKDFTPKVPAPFSVVQETGRIKMPGGGWFQHWSIVSKGKKLKGGVMVKHKGQRSLTSTYRDGVHVRGVHVGWLLTQQQ